MIKHPKILIQWWRCLEEKF